MQQHEAASNNVKEPPRKPRGHALALWRRSRAIQLATAGYTYEQIAREVGYANRGTAWRAVNSALQRQLVEDVELHRQMALDRLESLYAALWPRCEKGDLRAISAAIRNIDLQCRLLGMDGVSAQEPASASIVNPDHPAFLDSTVGAPSSSRARRAS